MGANIFSNTLVVAMGPFTGLSPDSLGLSLVESSTFAVESTKAPAEPFAITVRRSPRPVVVCAFISRGVDAGDDAPSISISARKPGEGIYPLEESS